MIFIVSKIIPSDKNYVILTFYQKNGNYRTNKKIRFI